MEGKGEVGEWAQRDDAEFLRVFFDLLGDEERSILSLYKALKLGGNGQAIQFLRMVSEVVTLGILGSEEDAVLGS